MLIKKSFAIIIVILALALVFSACGGKTETTVPFPPPPSTSTTTTVKPIPTTLIPTTPPTETPAATTPAVIPTTTVPPNTESAPVVTIEEATIIKMTNALLSGYVFAGEGIDLEGFEWGTGTGNYAFSWMDEGELKAGSFNHFLSELTEGTTYFFRGKAHNKFGWGYSEEKSFRTLGLPKISAVSIKSALLGKTLDVTVTGIDLTGATEVSLGDGITVNNINVSGDTQIVANITIAANAATGLRSLTVRTPVGSGTLADCFTVQQQKLVQHTVIWTDSQFDEIIHLMTAGSNYQYSLPFHEGNEVTMVSENENKRPFFVELRNGKLCFSNVPQNAWNNVFNTAGQYISYDSAGEVMTFNGFPEIVLKTMFDVPLETLPVFKIIATTEGRLTLYYNSLDIVS